MGARIQPRARPLRQRRNTPQPPRLTRPHPCPYLGPAAPRGGRMSQRQRGSRVVPLAEARPAPAAPSGAREEAPALYGVVLLKAALEIKRREDVPAADVLFSVLERMRIPEADFLRFLERQGGVLQALARAGGRGG